MRISDIISLFKDYLLLGIIGAIILGILWLICYKLIYKMLLSGEKEIDLKHMIVPAIFVIYVIVVICATFFNRGRYFGECNLHLFSSYKEAYYGFSATKWRNIILNILLFVPMGVLLPLLNKKLINPLKTVGLGFIITILIEILQYITKLGIFELDDIFNNTLGTLIGYSFIKIVFLIKNKEITTRKVKIFACTLPTILTIIAFSSIFAIYKLREFGNLEITAINRIDMKNVKIENNLQNLSSLEVKKSVYATKIYSKEEIEKFAEEFFKRLETKINNKYVYEETIVYNSENDHSLWVKYKGLSYNFIDFSMYTDDDNIDKGLEEKQVLDKLIEYGINIPEGYDYKLDIDSGMYVFSIEMLENENSMINGQIACKIYDDGKVKNINNNLINYEKVKECNIISEEQALDKIKKGEFRYLGNKKLESIKIVGLEQTYMLDTKGFYQPIYSFLVYINNQDMIQNIMIPAMKN